MQPDVLLLGPLYAPTMEALEQRFTLHRLWEADDRQALLRQHGAELRAIATTGNIGASADLMAQLPKLEIVGCYGVGYDAIDIAHASARGIKVTNTPDVLTDDVADLTVALMLAVCRRLVAADRFVREGRWLQGNFGLTGRMGGSRCGILGLGRIGKAIAKRLLPFGVEISYHGRHEQSDQPYRYYADLETMARDSDWLVAALPGGAESDKIVSRKVLQAVGPDGIFINVARGSVVDQAALVELLEGGDLGGAGLDVFEDEPRVPQELFAHDTVVLQPHLGSATFHTRAAMGDLVVRNLAAHFAGQPLLTPVN